VLFYEQCADLDVDLGDDRTRFRRFWVGVQILATRPLRPPTRSLAKAILFEWVTHRKPAAGSGDRGQGFRSIAAFH
jgi:hypothetical protein